MNYLKLIMKPFNFLSFKADVSAAIAVIATALTSFSNNYLGISGAFFAVLCVLTVADFWTGIEAARRKNIAITSKKGRKTLYKAGAYLLFMYVAFHLREELNGRAKVLEVILQYFHIFVVAHISFWELFSVDENLKKLDIDIGISEPLKKVYSNLKSILTNIGSKKTETDKDIE